MEINLVKLNPQQSNHCCFQIWLNGRRGGGIRHKWQMKADVLKLICIGYVRSSQHLKYWKGMVKKILYQSTLSQEPSLSAQREGKHDAWWQRELKKSLRNLGQCVVTTLTTNYCIFLGHLKYRKKENRWKISFQNNLDFIKCTAG